MRNSNLWALAPDYVEAVFAAENAEFLARGKASAESLSKQSPDAKPLYLVEKGVAIIGIRGTIARNSMYSFWSGEILRQGQDAIKLALVEALQDARVKAILLNINSPGGLVEGTKELADFIAEAASKKRCAAYADGLCASAAYWLAAATGTVFAPLTAHVGSIGVLSVVEDWTEWNKKMGIQYEYITAGKWKAAGNKDSSLTADERAYFQKRIDTIHTIFKADVAKNMRLTAAPETWGEAQILLAEEAQSAGLVTAIVRDLEEAVAQISMEEKMDKNVLVAQAPELVEALLAEGKAKGIEEANAEKQKTIAEAFSGVLQIVSAVLGQEASTKVEAYVEVCKKANITIGQMAAIAPMLYAQHGQDEALNLPIPDTEAQTREKLLAGIQAASQQVLVTKGEISLSKSTLLADAERRAQEARA